MDGAMVTCRSLWEILGVVRVKPSRGTPKACPFGRAISKLPPNVNVTRFNDQEITTLNEGIANKDVNAVEILKVLVGANSCVAHLDDDTDHEVTEHILDRVIDRTIIEIRDRIPNVPWRAFDRPKN